MGTLREEGLGTWEGYSAFQGIIMSFLTYLSFSHAGRGGVGALHTLPCRCGEYGPEALVWDPEGLGSCPLRSHL